MPAATRRSALYGRNKSTYTGGAWWDVADVYGAYDFKNAASDAASLIDLSGQGHNLEALRPLGQPFWQAGTGWINDGTASGDVHGLQMISYDWPSYLTAPLIERGYWPYTMICRANIAGAGVTSGFLMGYRRSLNSGIGILARDDRLRWCNTSDREITPWAYNNDETFGLSAKLGYFNGIDNGKGESTQSEYASEPDHFGLMLTKANTAVWVYGTLIAAIVIHRELTAQNMLDMHNAMMAL